MEIENKYKWIVWRYSLIYIEIYSNFLHTGRALIAGDGAIPQINRFAGMYSYSKLSINVFNKALMAMSQKSANPTGNE